MNIIKTLMGRREFLIAAGVTSTSALVFKKLAKLVDDVFKTSIAIAAESRVANIKKLGNPKCVIIYTSGTGNTEKVAKAIHKGVEQAVGNCDFFELKKANPRKLGGYDLIGFGCPVMGRRLKLNLENFIEDVRYVGGKHIFYFNTSHSGGNNFENLGPAFSKKGVIYIGGRAWHGSVYGPLGEPSPALWDGHPDKTDLEQAEAFGKEMVELSRKIYAGDTSLIPPEPAPLVWSPTRVSDAIAANDPRAELFAADEMENLEDYQKAVHWRLIYDQTKCLYPKCRLCVDICPVYGIDMTVEPRVIGKPCMNCWMCDQVCPTGAISVDPDQMEWQARIEQYDERAKDVKAQVELLKQQKLKDYPGFKYYVSEEQVAEGYGHQVYEVFNKRPRFIVGYGRPYGIDPATQEDRGPAPEDWPE